mgnify:CR=1 FL=1
MSQHSTPIPDAGAKLGENNMPKFQTLEDFLEKERREDETGQAVLQLCRQLRTALIRISTIVACGPLAGDLAAAQDTNADGDVQKKLDIVAHDYIIEALKDSQAAWILSEEHQVPIELDRTRPLAIAIDPLDGSSNIDANVSVGTIFSIHRRKTSHGDGELEVVLAGPNVLSLYEIDRASRTLTLSPRAAPETQRFQLLHQYALLAQRQLLEATLDNISQGISVVDAEQRLHTCPGLHLKSQSFQVRHVQIEPEQERPVRVQREIAEQVQIEAKYAGYIEKQRVEVARFRRLEDRRIPPGLDFEVLVGLRTDRTAGGRQPHLHGVGPTQDLAGWHRLEGLQALEAPALRVDDGAPAREGARTPRGRHQGQCGEQGDERAARNGDQHAGGHQQAPRPGPQASGVETAQRHGQGDVGRAEEHQRHGEGGQPCAQRSAEDPGIGAAHGAHGSVCGPAKDV